ncbi:alpha/beta hydrolase [Oscillospiraceae bacterium OttesenSCG-928-F05]|nr:alpha/beta hydrolase [Oscillospiraceae bacterium OttesenSCG-928-F05]
MTGFALEHDFVEYNGFFARPEMPRAAVCILHGIGEHSGRYGRFGDYMAEKGIAVYGVDLPGHGLSPGIRGHIGKRSEFYGFVEGFLTHAAEENPGVPLYLMGHSMGGNLALSYRLEHDDPRVTAYIIASPWLRLKHPPTFFTKGLIPLLATLRPALTMRSGLKSGTYRPEADGSGTRDPLIHGLITPRTAHDCFKASDRILARAGEPGKPVYLFHGTEDGICSIEGSRLFAAAAGRKICTFRAWKGLRHETLHESVWTDVADGVAGYILGE